MTLIVETGAGVTGADSYLSLAAADAHFTALANAKWAAASAGVREQALTRASAHVDFYDYPGAVLSARQGLKWPRKNAADREGRLLTGLPYALRTAVLEQAADYFEKPPDRQGKANILKEKVGPLELVYSSTRQQPGFVFRLLLQIGARPAARDLVRG